MGGKEKKSTRGSIVMIVAVIIFGAVLTIGTLVLTLVTINKGYAYKHTIDPLNEDGEVREYTGNGKRL